MPFAPTVPNIENRTSKIEYSILPFFLPLKALTPILYADELPGRTVHCQEEEYLYFAGTSYLGMGRNDAFGKLLGEGMCRYGYHYASSRNGNLQLTIYAQAEAYWAAFTGSPSAITVSSGLLAGQLVTNHLKGKGTFLCAPQTHPALWTGEVSPKLLSWQEWTQSIPEVISRRRKEHFVILTNSLDPLLVQPYDFRWLGQLPYHKRITLVVDDSHGLGITGHEGAGIYRQLSQHSAIELIVVASLGKALGLPGGVILGGQDCIESLRKSPFFSGASPMPPAYLHAFMGAKKVYQFARQQLQENIVYFTKAIGETRLFQFAPDYPVFYTPHHALYDFLKARKVLISSFPYPSPQSEPITRIVLNSLHTKADLDRLTEAIGLYQQEHL